MTVAKEQQPDAGVPPPGPPGMDPTCPSSDTGRAEDCSQTKDEYDDTSITETIASIKIAFAQKQKEFFALSDVVAAETELVKKSFLVTAMSTLAAFTCACFCWLIVNVAIGIALYFSDLGLLWICAVLLLINLLLAGFALKVAKDAYQHLTLMPTFEALVGQVGLKRDDEEEEH